MYCATDQFHEFQFLGPQKKPHGVYGLGKHYHMCFDPKLGHGMCEIRHIPCACNPCTSMLEQSWDPGMQEQKNPHYQPVKDFTYWPVLGSFNNWNIIQ